VLERERQAYGLSIYKLKRQLSFQGQSLTLSMLERLKSAA
jgi:hypothetical protein